MPALFDRSAGLSRIPVRIAACLYACLAGLACLGPAAQAAAVPPPFVHPGVLLDAAHLEYLKTQIDVGTEPYTSAFEAAKKSRWGSPNYEIEGPPSNGAIVCGPGAKPERGCLQEDNDASAAYLQALLWALSGDERYARKAIAIMNRYARVLRSHGGSNAALQAAWGAEKWTAAAEIMRYTYADWSDEDFAAFTRMLREKYLPLLTSGAEAGKNGSWALSMIDGTLGIAVVSDDHPLFDQTIARWRRWVPAYFYNFELDGPHPVMLPEGPTDWNGQTQFDAHTSGVTQETCSDTRQVQTALAATINAAETAYIQGEDLYTPAAIRLTGSLEYLARILQGVHGAKSSANPKPSTRIPIPPGFPGLCDGHGYIPVLTGTMERAYNAYAIRLGITLPHTRAHLLEDVRPYAQPNDGRNILWETLTHGALLDTDIGDGDNGSDNVGDSANANASDNLGKANGKPPQ